MPGRLLLLQVVVVVLALLWAAAHTPLVGLLCCWPGQAAAARRRRPPGSLSLGVLAWALLLQVLGGEVAGLLLVEFGGTWIWPGWCRCSAVCCRRLAAVP